MSDQYWGCSDKMSEANFSPAETLHMLLMHSFFTLKCAHSRAVTKIDVINSNIPSTHSGVSGLQRVKIVI